MSTIKADTLSDLAGTYTVPVATVAQGSAKAWVNFNGTGTVAIRASFNVTSITDNGTGTFAVNLTNALPNANYAVVTGGAPTTAATAVMYSAVSGNYTTTGFKLVTGYASIADIEITNVVVFD